MKTQGEEDRESTGTGEGLPSAVCSLLLPFARVCTFQSGFWQERKISPQSQRVPSGWSGGGGLGHGWCWGRQAWAGSSISWGLRAGANEEARQVGGSGGSLKVQDQGQATGQILRPLQPEQSVTQFAKSLPLLISEPLGSP